MKTDGRRGRMWECGRGVSAIDVIDNLSIQIGRISNRVSTAQRTRGVPTIEVIRLVASEDRGLCDIV